MNSFEVNKIMGAVLGTCLFIMGGSLVAEAIYAPAEDHSPGYDLPEAVAVADAGAGAGAATAAPAVSIATLLASANPEKGAATAKKCMACHNFGDGEPNKTGPHLYDIVGRAEGAVPDFAYSDAMKTHYANADVWNYDNLDHFLEKPSDYAPGTKMAFAGIKSETDRADLLSYLQTLSKSPVPFPVADAAPAAAAPAEAPAAEAPAAAAGGINADLLVLLTSADAAKGATVAKKCMACHTFGEGEANKSGPHLYDVVGRTEGSVADFNYSAALKTHQDNGDVWSYDNLDAFLAKPADYAPGTKMAFAGIKSETDRANLLAYLQTLSKSPVPFSAGDAAPAAAPAPEAAPAAEAAPAPAAEAAPAATAPAEAPAAAAPEAAAPAAAAGGTNAELLALLTAGDAAKGATVAKKCLACHTFGEGEANKSGPHLYDVVGRVEGSVTDFNYSPALKTHQDNGDVWSYDNLDAFLTKPADYAPGTKMAFAGIKSATDRANLLAYLQTLSASPVPFAGQ